MAVEKKTTESGGKKDRREIGIASDILISPRVTEKAAIKSDHHAYVFNVAKGATKQEIAKAVAKRYKVTPVKVNVAVVPKKRVFSRGQRGTKGGGRKAYVILKKDDKIEIV